jgi:hypothetical protein
LQAACASTRIDVALSSLHFLTAHHRGGRPAVHDGEDGDECGRHECDDPCRPPPSGTRYLGRCAAGDSIEKCAVVLG